MRHILIAVSGMSPAVVTETLYAIHRDGKAWPDEVRILTTRRGQETLLKGLPQAIARLCQDYDRPLIEGGALQIKVILDAEGQPIEDARSVDDHEALGDFIMREVRDVSAQKNVAIHASIAGGRKTMTYYLGYAMSLFGRPQDCLSHVLVSEGYEVEGFYYPTLESQILSGRDGQPLDAAKAEVVLADIPFIRLRQSLPPVLLVCDTNLRFRDLVKQIDLGEREPYERHLRLRLPLDRVGLEIYDVHVGYSRDTALFIPLKCVEYAFYRGAIRPVLEGDMRWCRPRQDDADMAAAIFREIGLIHGQEFDMGLMNEDLAELAADLEGPYRPDPRTVDDLKKGLTQGAFSQRVNDIKKVLEKSLPAPLARWLEIRVAYDKDGSLLGFYGDGQWPGASKGGDYGIALNKQQIEFID